MSPTRTGGPHRLAVPALLVSTGVAGLGFFPVFPLRALALPVAAAVVGVLLADLAAQRAPEPGSVRAPLALLAGALLSALVLVAGTSASPGDVARGAVWGWRRTLESTFPAWPEPALLAFVPALVLLAGVLGVEWLRRGVPVLACLLPATAVLVVAQLYEPAQGAAGLGLAVAFGLPAVVALATSVPDARRAGSRPSPQGGLRSLAVVLVVAAPAAVPAVLDPLGARPLSVHDDYQLPELPTNASSPLQELAGRLHDPQTPQFAVAADSPVDRWPLLVLDRFDGAQWSNDAHYRPLGSDLADADPVVETHSAQVRVLDLPGPWLPTQFRTRAVAGLRPAVDPDTGTLVAAAGTGTSYTVTWSTPRVDADRLVDAAVDPDAPGAVRPAAVPSEIVDLAVAATGGHPPSFDTALRLERWMQSNYQLPPAGEVPTGHSYAQLLRFLTASRHGTSEQFAAAYVVLAGAAGLPARLVVGFRQPAPAPGGQSPGVDGSGAETVVRNGDAFAWPEVAVRGVGWVPLDPTGGAQRGTGAVSGLAAATQSARNKLTDAAPPPPVPPPPPAPAQAEPASRGPGLLFWLGVGGAAVAAGAVVRLAGVPAAKAIRRHRRRRRPAADAVLGAWREARDRLHDHGVDVAPGTSVRDLGTAAGPVLDDDGCTALRRLAGHVDAALWSGAAVDRATTDAAWAATDEIGRSLRRRPLRERVGAALGTRTLTPRR